MAQADKTGAETGTRVLTFPTFRQHVSPREIQRFVVLRIECSVPSATKTLECSKKPEIRNRWL